MSLHNQCWSTLDLFMCVNAWFYVCFVVSKYWIRKALRNAHHNSGRNNGPCICRDIVAGDHRNFPIPMIGYVASVAAVKRRHKTQWCCGTLIRSHRYPIDLSVPTTLNDLERRYVMGAVSPDDLHTYARTPTAIKFDMITYVWEERVCKRSGMPIPRSGARLTHGQGRT